MSRCFPFPPPGYEARPRSEQQHKDLLRKEKRKEKKHRKEKDRGKGEGKENDRVHRKDKHNKKRKREKRRDKRKKVTDKDKKQSLGQGTQKNFKHGNIKPEERGQNEAVKDIKPTDELITRTFVQEGNAILKCDNDRSLLSRSTDCIGATGCNEKESNSRGRMVKKSVEATQEYHGMVQRGESIARTNKKGMGRGVDSTGKIKNGKNHQVGSDEMHSRRNHSCDGVDVRQDNSNAQRSFEDVYTVNPVDSRRETNNRITPSPNTLQKAGEMEPDPEISTHFAKGENGRISTKGSMLGKENQSANNWRGMNQQFVQNKDGEVEGKVKTNYRKAVKGKDTDRVVKKRKTGYKNKEKEMEKNGTVNEHKHEDLCEKKDQVDNLTRLGFLNETEFMSGSIKKWKDFDADSSPHEHTMRMTKLPRVSPTKDEEICRHSQQITPYSPTELLDTNTCEINLKQTHPDTKYLSQLYSIPPAQDFSGYIDQDWLFSQDRDDRNTAAFEAAESDHVWSDAQLIDTADVIALPYVVPL